ncbi:hypothetical protein KSP40_PGU012910 [Platanthera guangdongensis]|uniref:Uncharacterized protein n=1 Tax=Platanthera guangdongensis TaxID=2320717 RepID=A0ABR2ME15_9ASPA
MSDRDTQKKLSQLINVFYGKQQVSGDDAALLVVSRDISHQFQNLGGEILENDDKVDRGTTSDVLGIPALLGVSANSSDEELKAGLDGAGDGLLPATAALPATNSLCILAVASMA